MDEDPFIDTVINDKLFSSFYKFTGSITELKIESSFNQNDFKNAKRRARANM